uniref:Ribosomal protein n=2 Tax=Gouania willdenowi TaxID=441366 RepID=A0A8C5EZA8_GOUWI
MTPLLMKHLVTSLTRQVVQMSRFNLNFSLSPTSAYRCFSALTVTSPRTLLLSSSTVCSSSSSAHCGLSLLKRCQNLLLSFQPSVGMKTKSALKRRCKDCFFVVRRGRLFVFCKTHPRHKQRQG